MKETTLREKRVLVTGSNSGIGASIARQLAVTGAKVAVNYVVDREAATAVAEEVRRAGASDILAIEADVAGSTRRGAVSTSW